MANYITHTDIQYAKFLTASSNKAYGADQQTALLEIITDVHGELVEIIGSEPAVTKGLKNIEKQGVLRAIWNAENPEKEPLEYFTEFQIIKIKEKYATPDAEKEPNSEVYAKETN
jgi:hypothetical protein